MVMQLLAGSKLLEVDQSVKDWDKNFALTWKTLAMYAMYAGGSHALPRCTEALWYGFWDEGCVMSNHAE